MERYISTGGPFDQPLSHLRTALLTVAMALAAVVCAELVTVGRTTHAIKLDVPVAGQHDVPRPVHLLEIGADGAVAFDGRPVAGLTELRARLDALPFEDPLPLLEVEPAASLRYADFIAVLAVIKRAHVYPLCIDLDPESRNAEPINPGLTCSPPPLL